jgi:hypothetical protein
MVGKQVKGKLMEVIDNPGTTIEKGVKRGLETIVDIGKEVTDTVTKKLKEKQRTEHHDDKYSTSRMVLQKGLK